MHDYVHEVCIVCACSIHSDVHAIDYVPDGCVVSLFSTWSMVLVSDTVLTLKLALSMNKSVTSAAVRDRACIIHIAYTCVKSVTILTRLLLSLKLAPHRTTAQS